MAKYVQKRNEPSATEDTRLQEAEETVRATDALVEMDGEESFGTDGEDEEDADLQVRRRATIQPENYSPLQSPPPGNQGGGVPMSIMKN